LRSPSRGVLELNEVRWWSNWAHVAWLGSSGYLLTSKSFKETFFNRACILNCRGVDSTVAWAEGRLMAQDTVSTVTIFDSCTKAARGLRASGYRPVDTMTVMLSISPTKPADAVKIKIKERPAPDSWTRAYLEAFYGDQELAPHVTRIVARLQRLHAVTLLEAIVGDETAGVLAIFRTEGLVGIYCVGTVPEHRRKGVAGTLVSKAVAISRAEGRRLFLQSLASDGTLRYYLERGFKVLYSKKLLLKES
jgi:GNAT superfamily N-acetyltransferase